jgi:predicted AlkP superfamily pyrophosphatase or phosphodiesterase
MVRKMLGLFLIGSLGMAWLWFGWGSNSSEASDEAKGDPAPYVIPSLRRPSKGGGEGFGAAEYVLFVSLDGVRGMDLERYRRDTPNLWSLAKRGFRCSMETIFPSVTWASHLSMMTGQYPSHHGTLGNRWLENYTDLIFPYDTSLTDPERRTRTPSLFDLAHKQGWPTAALNWPGTQEATTLTYNLPAIMYNSSLWYRYTSKPLRALLEKMYNQMTRGDAIRSKEHRKALFGRILHAEKMETDILVTELAKRLVAGEGQIGRLRGRRAIPRLSLVHYGLADVWAHKYGNNGWSSRWALALNDMLLGQVIAAYKKARIWKKTAVFVASDHGFLNSHLAMDPRLLLKRKGFSRYVTAGRRERRREKVMAFQTGHITYLYIKPAYRKNIPKIIRLFKSTTYQSCVKAVYTPEAFAQLGLPMPPPTPQDEREQPYRYHRGAPDLIVLAQPTCTFVRGHRRDIIKPVTSTPQSYFFGTHGYLPNHPEMLGIWVASGAGVRRDGHLAQSCRIVDLAPTMAHLMGLRWPQEWTIHNKTLPFQMAGQIRRDLLRREKKK